LQARITPYSSDRKYLTTEYNKIERPGIHSLRSLGVWLYTQAGYDDSYIMALSGHATKRMKDHYYDGHEKPAPVNVQADLSLDNVDLTDIDWETDLSEPLKEIVIGNE